MSELKPCPFCGSDAEYVVDFYQEDFVTCSSTSPSECPLWSCGMSVEQWNTRVQPAPADEQIERGAKALREFPIKFKSLPECDPATFGELAEAVLRAALQGKK